MGKDEDLKEFAECINRQMAKIRSSDGEEAGRLNEELSTMISIKMSELISKGYPVPEIQKYLNEAIESVPNSYAPDAKDSEYQTEGTDLENAQYNVMFAAVREQTIKEYGTGRIDRETFVENIDSGLEIPMEIMEFIELIITDYDADSPFAEIISDGEIVTDSEGEALIPKLLWIKDDSENSGTMAEPMTYKTPKEVRTADKMADTIDEKIFKKRFDIKKLAKFSGLDRSHPSYHEYMDALRENENGIREATWLYFNEIKKLYKYAATEENICILMFTMLRNDGAEEL